MWALGFAVCYACGRETCSAMCLSRKRKVNEIKLKIQKKKKRIIHSPAWTRILIVVDGFTITAYDLCIFRLEHTQLSINMHIRVHSEE